MQRQNKWSIKNRFFNAWPKRPTVHVYPCLLWEQNVIEAMKKETICDCALQNEQFGSLIELVLGTYQTAIFIVSLER